MLSMGWAQGRQPAYRHVPCSMMAGPLVYLCDDILLKQKC